VKVFSEIERGVKFQILCRNSGKFREFSFIFRTLHIKAQLSNKSHSNWPNFPTASPHTSHCVGAKVEARINFTQKRIKSMTIT
jgi:hypothetical protein